MGIALSSMKGPRFQETYLGELIMPWPLEFFHVYAVEIAGLLFLLVAAYALARGPRVSSMFLLASGSLFVSKVLVSIKENMAAGTMVSGLAEVAFSFLFIFLVPLFFMNERSFRSVVNSFSRVITIAGLIFAAASIYIAVRTPAAAFWNGRFNGASGHPLFVAMIFSICTYVSSVGFLYSRRLGSKVTYLLITLLFAGLMIATGSRSPLVALFVAYLITWLRNMKLLIALLVAFVAVSAILYLSYRSVPGVENFIGNRFTSTSDTRSVVWGRLWNTFLEYPLWGAPHIDTNSESSFLKYFVRTGVIGMPTFFSFLFVWIYLFLMSLKHLLASNDRPQIQLGVLVAGLLSYFMVFAVFEGYLWDVASFSYFVLYLTTMVGILLFDRRDEPHPETGEISLR